MPTTQFRLAHVSDLHLAAKPGEAGLGKWTNTLHTCVAYIVALFRGDYRPCIASYHLAYIAPLTRALMGRTNQSPKPYDGYIFSGDLATTGIPEDMAAAAAYLNGKKMFTVDSPFRLSLVPSKVVVIPGNHDRYEGRLLWPSSAQFERRQHFGADWSLSSPTHSDLRKGVNGRVIEKDGVRLGVVCGDLSFTTLNSPRLSSFYLGGGCVEKDIVDEMVARTEVYKAKGIPSIWVVHHSPVRRFFNPFLALRKSHLLGDAAIAAGVKYILCGHTHKPSSRKYATTSRKSTERVRVLCTGSATSLDTKRRCYSEWTFSVSNGKNPSIILQDRQYMEARETQLRLDGQPFANRIEFIPILKGWDRL